MGAVDKLERIPFAREAAKRIEDAARATVDMRCPL